MTRTRTIVDRTITARARRIRSERRGTHWLDRALLYLGPCLALVVKPESGRVLAVVSAGEWRANP